VILLDNLTEMLKGVLEGCVLEIISRKETYGYEITRRLNALGFSDVVEGTVYTILIRLERNKLVEISKKPSWALRASSLRSTTRGERNYAGSGQGGSSFHRKSKS